MFDETLGVLKKHWGKNSTSFSNQRKIQVKNNYYDLHMASIKLCCRTNNILLLM